MTVCKALGGGVAASAAECAGTATGGGSRRSAIMSALGKPAVERIAVGCMGGPLIVNAGAGSACWQHDRPGLAVTHAQARAKRSRVRAHACVGGPRQRVRRDHAIQRMARLATLPTSSAAPGRRAEFLCAATKSHRPARRRINPARRRCWRAARTLCRHRRARALGLAQAGAERYAGDCDGTAPARCVAGNAAATSAGSGCCQSRSGGCGSRRRAIGVGRVRVDADVGCGGAGVCPQLHRCSSMRQARLQVAQHAHCDSVHHAPILG